MLNTKKALQEEVEKYRCLYYELRNSFELLELAHIDEISKLKQINTRLKEKYAEVVEENFRMAEKIYEMSKGDDSDGKR